MEVRKVFERLQRKFEEKYASDPFAYAGFAVAKYALMPIALAVEECKEEGRPLPYELHVEFSKALSYPNREDFPQEMQKPMKLMGRLFQRRYGHLASEIN
jgi:hypothetical protein